MDLICPLLQLGTDRRAVCDAFDVDHRCGAAGGPPSLERTQQVRFCLAPAHVECPHFARHAISVAEPRIAGLPPPAPDVLLPTTRLVIDADRAMSRSRSSLSHRARPVFAAAILVAAGTGVAATGAVQRLGGLLGSAADPIDDASGFVVPTSTPSPSPTAAPTAAPPLATTVPSVTPAATAASSVLGEQRYVVQPGDTLKAIADRFTTTVAALQEANGIADENLIKSGQVLSIP